MKVSIILNCRNGAEYLKDTLEAIKQQSFSDYEIIFWDNCSTDNSAQIAKTFDKRLRYFLGEEMLPLGAARNKAIACAQGDYIAFVDCDDLWDREKLEKQVNELERDSSVGICYPTRKIFLIKRLFIENFHSRNLWGITAFA